MTATTSGETQQYPSFLKLHLSSRRRSFGLNCNPSITDSYIYYSSFVYSCAFLNYQNCTKLFGIRHFTNTNICQFQASLGAKYCCSVTFCLFKIFKIHQICSFLPSQRTGEKNCISKMVY